MHGVRNYKISYLNKKEYDKLNSSLDSPRDRLIIKLLYQTGCTVNELVNIRYADFDLKKNTLSISKKHSRNKEPRKVFVSTSQSRPIRDYRKDNPDSPFLFYTRQSKNMTTKRIRQLVKYYCRRVGIKNASPQILRYTHIVHAYEKRIPIDAIQRQVGLKRSRAIEIFSQLKLTKIKDAYKDFR